MGFSSLISGAVLSPNYNVRKNKKFNPLGKVLKITPHHTAGVMSAEGIANSFASSARQASCNYAIGNDGTIYGVVDENNRAWTTSSPENDYIAITVEISNSEYGYPWYVSNKAINSFIKLAVDICKRHEIKEINYTGDKSGNLTAHRWFAATACPGDYLYSKLPNIANSINKKLWEDEEEMTAAEKKEFAALKATVEAQQKIIDELTENAKVKYKWFTGGTAKRYLVPAWAEEDIKYLYNKGYLAGNKYGSLELTGDLTRALVILSRALQGKNAR